MLREKRLRIAYCVKEIPLRNYFVSRYARVAARNTQNILHFSGKISVAVLSLDVKSCVYRIH